MADVVELTQMRQYITSPGVTGRFVMATSPAGNHSHHVYTLVTVNHRIWVICVSVPAWSTSLEFQPSMPTHCDE